MAYNKDTDYQALINKAVAKGDYKAAAQYEQQRNEKIAGLNATGTNKYNATTTNNYKGWLDDTDYGTIGKQQMALGASADDVLETYNNRYNKANGTIGLQQYANDEIQQEMWDYIMANQAQTLPPTFDYSSYQESKPTFESNYAAQIDAKLAEILNRDAFSYDVNSDPLYAQYAAMYGREGNRAMNDTLAAAAANAGGMNSYAVTAAQQANNYYAAQAADKVPELYQLAYEMYLDDIDLKVQDMGLLTQMDDTQYNRYRDTMSDWRDDRDFAYNMYRDEMGDYQWDQSFDYQKDRDKVSDNRWQTEFDYNVGRDQVSDAWRNQEWAEENERYDNETAYARAMELINAGVMPDAEQLAAAGLSSSQASLLIAAVKAAQVSKSSGGGGGSSGGSSGGSKSKAEDDDDDGYVEVNHPKEINGKPLDEYSDAAGNYAEMASMCEEVYNSDGKEAVLDMLREAYSTGALNLNDYSVLFTRYRDKADKKKTTVGGGGGGHGAALSY